MKKLLLATTMAVLAMPVAGAIAFLLVPFWRWIEAKYGIESIGHSGPANWCFGAVYGVVLLAAFAIWRWFPARPGAAELHDRG